jgi:hypothetical protein
MSDSSVPDIENVSNQSQLRSDGEAANPPVKDSSDSDDSVESVSSEKWNELLSYTNPNKVTKTRPNHILHTRRYHPQGQYQHPYPHYYYDGGNKLRKATYYVAEEQLRRFKRTGMAPYLIKLSPGKKYDNHLPIPSPPDTLANRRINEWFRSTQVTQQEQQAKIYDNEQSAVEASTDNNKQPIQEEDEADRSINMNLHESKSPSKTSSTIVQYSSPIKTIEDVATSPIKTTERKDVATSPIKTTERKNVALNSTDEGSVLAMCAERIHGMVTQPGYKIIETHTEEKKLDITTGRTCIKICVIVEPNN